MSWGVNGHKKTVREPKPWMECPQRISLFLAGKTEKPPSPHIFLMDRTSASKPVVLKDSGHQPNKKKVCTKNATSGCLAKKRQPLSKTRSFRRSFFLNTSSRNENATVNYALKEILSGKKYCLKISQTPTPTSPSPSAPPS